jgi:endonuclease-3
MTDSGVYCLLLRLAKGRTIRVARRERTFPAGYYLYVGSAMNGLEARIRRHLSSKKKPHWHIDSLTRHANIHRVFRQLIRSKDAECRLARKLSSRKDTTEIRGFGSSDCRCSSHLFYFQAKPDFNPFDLLRRTQVEHVVRTLSGLYTAPKACKSREPFRSLITCIISLRTKDEVTDPAGARLFQLARTPAKMASLPASRIAKTIYPAGFYRQKGKTIKEISEILVSRHGGRVPGNLDDLVALPGVGRKTANLVLGRAFGQPAICVDTHVHRISNRLGWVATDTPDETEIALQRVLAPEHWTPMNALLVRHGQETCHPTSPLCSTCALERDCLRDGVTRSR